MQTKPPATPNPFTWRGLANVRMGDYILGEDTVDLASLGFCGDTVNVACSTYGELLGAIPMELCGEEFRDLTTTTSPRYSIGTTQAPSALCLNPNPTTRK